MFTHAGHARDPPGGYGGNPPPAGSGGAQSPRVAWTMPSVPQHDDQKVKGPPRSRMQSASLVPGWLATRGEQTLCSRLWTMLVTMPEAVVGIRPPAGSGGARSPRVAWTMSSVRQDDDRKVRGRAGRELAFQGAPPGSRQGTGRVRRCDRAAPHSEEIRDCRRAPREGLGVSSRVPGDGGSIRLPSVSGVLKTFRRPAQSIASRRDGTIPGGVCAARDVCPVQRGSVRPGCREPLPARPSRPLRHPAGRLGPI